MQQAPWRWTLVLLAALAVSAGCGDSNHGRPPATPTAVAVATDTAPPSATSTSTASVTPTSPPPATATPPPTSTATTRPTDTPAPPTSAQVLAAGPYGVGVTTITFEDASRSTMPNRTFPGAATRTLVTEVWYPAAPVPSPPPDGLRDAPPLGDGAPCPLVIYSHGLSDTRTSGGFLGRHLASHGYVVAAIDFPLSNFFAPGGPGINDIAQQPGDVSFVISQLLALTQQPGGRWLGLIDPDRIGLTGLSLGGLTTTLTAFHPTLRDPRVRAAAPVAGIACLFGSPFYDASRLPLLVVHGDLDALVPYQENGRFQFSTANAPKYLVTVHGGSHVGFSPIGSILGGDNPDDAGCVALGAILQAPGGSPDFLDLLGGTAAGLLAEPNCPLPCADPTPRPAALPVARQLDLETLALFPFFEATLRGNQTMQQFLATRLAAENPEITFESTP